MFKNLPAYIAWTRKALVNLLGLLTSLLALGVLPAPYAGWVASAIAVLTVIVHFNISNAPAPGTATALDGDEEAEVEQPPEWQPSELITPSHIAAAHKQAAPPSN